MNKEIKGWFKEQRVLLIGAMVVFALLLYACDESQVKAKDNIVCDPRVVCRENSNELVISKPAGIAMMDENPLVMAECTDGERQKLIGLESASQADISFPMDENGNILFCGSLFTGQDFVQRALSTLTQSSTVASVENVAQTGDGVEAIIVPDVPVSQYVETTTLEVDAQTEARAKALYDNAQKQLDWKTNLGLPFYTFVDDGDSVGPCHAEAGDSWMRVWLDEGYSMTARFTGQQVSESLSTDGMIYPFDSHRYFPARADNQPAAVDPFYRKGIDIFQMINFNIGLFVSCSSSFGSEDADDSWAAISVYPGNVLEMTTPYGVYYMTTFVENYFVDDNGNNIGNITGWRPLTPGELRAIGK